MARSARVAVTAALLVALLVAAPAEGAVTSCGQVAGFLEPCIGYAMGKVTSIPATCCGGVRKLKAAAATPGDRKTTCNCLKGQTSMGGIKPDLVAGIPAKCNVNIPYAISASTDCAKVN